MTTKQKTALEMRATGMSYTRIAKEMGITQPAAFALVKRAVSESNSGTYGKCIYPAMKERMDTLCINGAQLAERVGRSKNMVYMYLRGVRQPSLETAVKMCEVLGLSVEEAFKENA